MFKLMPRIAEALRETRGYTVWKTTYSIFAGKVHTPIPRLCLQELLQGPLKHIDCFVVCGVETDMCVLSTVLAAVDLGYRVVIATDACGSSNEASGKLQLSHTMQRFDHQVELGTVDEICAAANRKRKRKRQ